MNMQRHADFAATCWLLGRVLELIGPIGKGVGCVLIVTPLDPILFG